MGPLSSDTAGLCFSSQVSTAPTTRSTKFPSELRDIHYPTFILCQSSKRSSSSSSVGLQKNTQKDLSRILRTESAIKEIERKAKSKKYNNLWPKAVLEALDEAIRENRHVSALKIFSLLRKQHWYEPRCQTYTKLLMMLGKCKQPEQAGLLFELMLAEGLKPTLDIYTALVSAYGHSGLIDKALSTIEAMKSVSDCKPDLYTYSILVKCCAKFHHFDLIEQIICEMSYLGISCSTVTYNSIVDGYGKAKMFEQMEKSLTDMIDSGSCLPDVFTLNSVVGAYGKNGRIDKMEKWYEEFQLMGIRPDIVTFNTLIGSYGKAGLYEKMISVFNYMEKRFFSPTTTTYNIIIDIYGKAGDVEKMEEYFKKMKHRGMKPTSVTYCSLVSAYSITGLIMKMDSILRQVQNSDVVLDIPFFNCIISAYGQAGDIEKMRELFLLMKERNCSPDTITYTNMIQTYNALGMTEIAEDLKKGIIRTRDHPGLKFLGR